MKYFFGVVSLSLFLASSTVALASGDAANGEKLWKSKKCKNCHDLGTKNKLGPAIKGVTKKRSEAWLVEWMKNPQKVWEENDAETQKMRKWKKGRGAAKKTKMKIRKLSDQEVADLIAFMEKNDG